MLEENKHRDLIASTEYPVIYAGRDGERVIVSIDIGLRDGIARMFRPVKFPAWDQESPSAALYFKEYLSREAQRKVAAAIGKESIS
jgi:hypothetical protein